VGIKRKIQGTLNKMGYHLDKIDRNSSSMHGGLLRAAAQVEVQSFIDVGASDGRWAEICMNHYPNAQFLLIEAQPGHEADLQRFTGVHKNTNYLLAAASDEAGEVFFDASDLHAGLASKEELSGKDTVRLPAVRIDEAVVARPELQAPFALKLDTHGYELPIFRGAEGILKDTNLIIVEAYNFVIAQEAIRFFELCLWLEERGFRCVDIVDIMRRPKDGALWQMDLFFYRKDHPVFESDSYA